MVSDQEKFQTQRKFDRFLSESMFQVPLQERHPVPRHQIIGQLDQRKLSAIQRRLSADFSLSVTVDQINLVTEKYYPRQTILKTEGLILECLQFEIPEVTVFSELYNELKPLFGKKTASYSNKEN